MTVGEIVAATSGIVYEIIGNMPVKEKHKDDLAQEIYTILLGQPQEKMQHLYDTGQIRFYIARIITNQYNSTHSTFYKEYKKYEVNCTEITPKMENNG